MGYLAPKGSRQKWFSSVKVEGLHYCKSHNFFFDPKVEEEKLHNGQPCFYTDSRYTEGLNYYKECYLLISGIYEFSLKSLRRKVRKARNIPVGSTVKFCTSWYYPNNTFLYKIRIENKFEPNYQVSRLSFHNNFLNCNRSKELVDILRDVGFLVEVWNTNPGFLIGGEEEGGEFAIAYGHGKKVGFSSHNNSFRGYQNGCENILWDKYGDFDKWSRCNEISKESSFEEILEILKG